MRVLVVATTHAEDGGRWIDVDGELAILPVPDPPAAGPGHEVPAGFVGLDSGDAASIVAVAEVDVSPHVLMDYVRESLARHRAWDAAALVDISARVAAEMLDIARRFPVGTVLAVEGTALTAHIPVRRAARSPVCEQGSRDRRGR